MAKKANLYSLQTSVETCTNPTRRYFVATRKNLEESKKAQSQNTFPRWKTLAIWRATWREIHGSLQEGIPKDPCSSCKAQNSLQRTLETHTTKTETETQERYTFELWRTLETNCSAKKTKLRPLQKTLERRSSQKRPHRYAVWVNLEVHEKYAA